MFENHSLAEIAPSGVFASTPPKMLTYCESVVAITGTNAGPLTVGEITHAGVPTGELLTVWPLISISFAITPALLNTFAIYYLLKRYR